MPNRTRTGYATQTRYRLAHSQEAPDLRSNFWHKRWETSDIGFHQEDGNPLFQSLFGPDYAPAGARVFLPFCGKTRDIAWLLANGYRVAGNELVVSAVDQLFEDLQVAPVVTDRGALQHYQAEGIDIYAGDMYELDRDRLGNVDIVYDRAALVALPEDMRDRYVGHLTAMTGLAPHLLLTFEYNQDEMNGPPFSVTPDVVRRHYDATFNIEEVARQPVRGKLKGQVEAEEVAWHLTRN